MMLRLWLPRLADLRADSPVAFEVLGAKRDVLRRGEAVPASLPRAERCECVLHPFDVTLLPVRLPRLTSARLAAALPGIVEERIACDVEHVHVVASPRDASGQATAAVVDRALFGRALDLLGRAGVRVSAATPGPLALPLEAGHWSVAVAEGAGSVRWAPAGGASFGTTGDEPQELIALAHEHPPGGIALYGGDVPAGWLESLGVPVRRMDAYRSAPPVALDLLQYAFAPRLGLGKSWRPTAVLVALLAAIAIGGLNVHAWQLRTEERALRNTMAQAVRERFPEVTVVLDPLAQMRRLVATLEPGADPNGFAPLAAAAGRIAPTDSLDTLDYREGVLGFTLRSVPPVTEAERAAIGQRAAAEGFRVEGSGTALRLVRTGER